jgi:hypothetical protein
MRYGRRTVQSVGQFQLSDILTLIKTNLYTTKIAFFYTFHNRHPQVLLKFKKRVLSDWSLIIAF